MFSKAKEIESTRLFFTEIGIQEAFPSELGFWTRCTSRPGCLGSISSVCWLRVPCSPVSFLLHLPAKCWNTV